MAFSHRREADAQVASPAGRGRREATGEGTTINPAIAARADEGAPPTSGFVPVQEIADRWRIDDDWWRKEISRMYFRVVLAGGRVLTVFQDLIAGDWFLQTTATPRHGVEPLDVLVPRVAVHSPAAEREGVVTPIRRTGRP
jgi:hypothetical protein